MNENEKIYIYNIQLVARSWQSYYKIKLNEGADYFLFTKYSIKKIQVQEKGIIVVNKKTAQWNLLEQ